MKEKEFTKHFRSIKEHLWLGHWKIDLYFWEAEDNQWIETVWKVLRLQRDHLFAELEFNKDILGFTKEEVIETIFHELLHVCMWFYKKDAVDNVGISEDSDINEAFRNTIFNSIHHQEEIMIATMCQWLTKLYLTTP